MADFNWDDYELEQPKTANKNAEFNWDDYAVENSKPQKQSQTSTQTAQQPLQANVTKTRIQNWDKNGNIYYTDENGNRVNDKEPNWFEKYPKKWAREHFNELKYSPQKRRDLAVEIASLPIFEVGKGIKAAAWGTKKLTPYLGKKIGQSVAENSIGGAFGGGLMGLTQGFDRTNEHPYIEAAKTGVLGSLMGLGLGAGASFGLGKLEQNAVGRKLKNIKDTKTLRKAETGYYKDYIQQTSVKRPDLGNIDFTQAGLETVSKSPESGRNFATLKKDIKNAKYVGTELPNHQRTDNIVKFHKLEKDGQEFLIGETPDGKKYYMSKVKDGISEQPSRAVPKPSDNIIPQSEKNITPETEILRNFDTESALKNTAKEAKTNFKQNIEDLKAQNTTHEYITNAKQGHFFKTIAEDDLTYGIKEAGQELNSILKDIKKNPNIVNDDKVFSELEERIIKKAEGLPQEVQEEIYNKFYNAYNEAQDFINTSQKVDSYATSQLEQSARSAKGTPRDIKKILKDGVQYEKLTNDELTRLATEAVEKDFNGVYNDLIGRASDNRYSALDFENARQLTKRLFAEGTEEANKMAVNLIDVVSEKGSKAGQAVQAMSLWNDLTPEGAVYKAQKIIKDYNGKIKNGKRIALTNEQIQQIKANQEAVANATDPYEKSVLSAKSMQFIADILPKNASKKVKALRNLSLLLNAKTLERNIIGNALFNAVDTGSKALAVPIDRLLGKFTKQNTRVLPQLGEYLKGGLQGTKRGYQEALQGIDTRNLGQRFDLGQGRTFQNPVLQKLETGLDVGLRVPDRTFYEATKAESIANQLKARGLKEVTPEIEEIANQEALEAVFQNESKISDLTLDFRRALNKLGTKDFGLGDVLIPYAQTPANLTQQAINYSPLGIGKAIGNLAQGNQRQASLDIARSLIGSGMIGGAYGLTKQGYLTPAQYADNYFKNRQIKENKKLLGETPNQLGDVWYAPFQPMSTLGAVGSAMATGENPIQAGANSLLDLPFLQGVTRAVKTVQEGDPVGAVINTALDAPNQFIPTAVSQIAQLADNTQRETYSDNKAQQALNRMLVKIPIASKTLPAKQNVKGEDVQRYTSKGIGRVWDTFLNPTFINKKQDDRVVQELFEISNNTDENLLLPVADKKLTINGQKITLNAREFNRYQKLLGQETYSQIADFMNTEEYQYLTDEEKAKAIKKIKTNAKFDTEATLFGRTKNRTRRK